MTGLLCLLRAAAVAAAAQAAAAPQAAPLPPYVVVLGIAQDGGVPQAGCARPCCAGRWHDASAKRHVACLGIVDPASGQRWLIDATPDFAAQLRCLDELAPPAAGTQPPGLDGILLTHAHVGHYAGLMDLGREVMGATGVPVYAMPRMTAFLAGNGPWAQLVELGNVALKGLLADEPLRLSRRLAMTPIPVPHRDEYSETVGFRIEGPGRSALYIPDVDKWERFDRRIEELIAAVDVAWIDGTFFADGEVTGRSIEEVPHPFIAESVERFRLLSAPQRDKVRFIHLNHTNPALGPDSEARKAVESAGLHVAEELERFEL
jgi:pyrroloquinoline quinone biosynthesis protein B